MPQSATEAEWGELRRIEAQLQGTDELLNKLLKRVEKITPKSLQKDGEEFYVAKDQDCYMRQAAWHYADNLLHHVYYGDFPDSAESWESFCDYARWQYRSQMSAIILLVLTFFEIPLWCLNSRELENWRFLSEKELCVIPGASNGAVVSGVPMVPVAIGVAIEAVCYGIMCLRFWSLHKMEHHFKAIGKSYVMKEMSYVESPILAIGILDVLYFTFIPTTFRLAHFVRFAIGLTSLKPLRRQSKGFVAILWEIRMTAIIFLGLILLFGWLTAILFDDVETEINGDKVNIGLKPFTTALYTSFLTSTTVNLPYVMIPTYTYYRPLMLLWFIMILAGCLVLAQIILAVVYNKYQDTITSQLKASERNRMNAQKASFKDLLKYEGPGKQWVSRETFHVFCDKIEEVAGVEEKNKEHEDIYFDWLDDCTGDSATGGPEGCLSQSEFLNISKALLCKLDVTQRDSIIQTKFADTQFAQWLKKMCHKDVDKCGERGCSDYDNSPLENGMKVVLGLNICLIAYESVLDLSGEDEPAWQNYVDTAFAFVYLFEVCIKLGVWHWSEYWWWLDNKFDFSISIALSGFGVATLVWEGDYHNTLVILTFLRALRVLKALEQIDVFSETLTCIKRMIKTCWDVMMMVLYVHYLWAAMGMILFGGKMYQDNPAFQKVGVDGQDVVDDGDLPTIEVFNFNDMFMGNVTLFFFTLTNYLDTVAGASFALYERGSFGWWLSYGFMYSFYVASPLVVWNILTAFSIDVFCKIQEDDGSEEFLGSFENLKNKYAQNGKVLHVVATTELRQSLTLESFFADELKSDEDDAEKKDGDDQDGDGNAGDGEEQTSLMSGLTNAAVALGHGL